MRRTICRAVAATAVAMALSIGMGGIANADSAGDEDLVQAHMDDHSVDIDIDGPAMPLHLPG